MLKGKLRLRQVTRLMDNGHQTPILTSRRDLPAAQVAYRMFERWRQENFFKYLREEYALDALVEYAAVPDDPTREVPNPAWAALDSATAPSPRPVGSPASRIWPGGVDQLGTPAPDDARVQNGPGQAGPENLAGLAAGAATGETPRRHAAPSSRPKRQGGAGGQTGSRTKTSDQSDQDGGLSSRERPAAVGRTPLSKSGSTKVEHCSNRPWPARQTWKSLRRSCGSPWRRKVRRIAHEPSQRFARNSILTNTLFPGSQLRLRYAIQEPS